MKKASSLVVIGTLTMWLSACQTMDTVVDHSKLAATTKASETIFVDPVPNSQKVVYVLVKNTSDQDLEVDNKLKGVIKSHGYQITSNPNRAHYILQANILKIGKMNRDEANSALSKGYGAALTGLASAGLASAITDSSNTALGAGIVGAAAGYAASALIKDVNYSMITDVQLSERLNHAVEEKTNALLKNGSSTSTVQASSNTTNLQKYRTRIVSNVDKMNLKYAEAKPALEDGLAKVIGGIL